MMGVKISYAICVKDEFIEIQNLIKSLLKNKRQKDNIVILFDGTNGDIEIENFLRTHSVNNEFMWHKGNFEGHFANWKNKLNSLCDGDYIFNIDADEILTTELIRDIPSIIENNSNIDLFWVSRINTLYGDTEIVNEYVKFQNWTINEKGWINFPFDYQGRIYRQSPNIRWDGKIHEKIVGHLTQAKLPSSEEYSLLHPKMLARQIKQNELYNKL
jgi:hypothetical protein